MSFYNQTIYCPICPMWKTKRGETVGEQLDLSESNYSSCGVDICYCEKCKKYYQISYKVDEITQLDWDLRE